MIDRIDYIKIDKMIKVIERAANKNIISKAAAETIIQDIYHEADKNPWKTP